MLFLPIFARVTPSAPANSNPFDTGPVDAMHGRSCKEMLPTPALCENRAHFLGDCVEHRGVQITLIETCGDNERVEVGDYSVSRRNGQIFGATSRLEDCKSLIDAALRK